MLSKETAAAWAKREGVTFYLVNEKFSSVTFEYLTQQTRKITRENGLSGYWEGRQITGPNAGAPNAEFGITLK
ncbi:hypothetical protein ET33_13330 [Paenibacillus tyrfis]|uniref:Uncharacterized protein n=1 Tax=Paenibacillus tyrfis TaxID=1501230 RepID=A0A081PAE3_9BACL|nr:hypothetical protein ET33_13330 [Paenibacillus tyrfis]